jgi:lipoate-protein ligase B
MPTSETFFGGSPYSTGGWVPLTAPMIIPVGLPITYKCSCNGVELIAIEIQTDLSSEGQIASIGAREDLVVSISASQ